MFVLDLNLKDACRSRLISVAGSFSCAIHKLAPHPVEARRGGRRRVRGGHGGGERAGSGGRRQGGEGVGEAETPVPGRGAGTGRR